MLCSENKKYKMYTVFMPLNNALLQSLNILALYAEISIIPVLHEQSEIELAMSYIRNAAIRYKRMQT